MEFEPPLIPTHSPKHPAQIENRVDLARSGRRHPLPSVDDAWIPEPCEKFQETFDNLREPRLNGTENARRNRPQWIKSGRTDSVRGPRVSRGIVSAVG